MPCCTLDSLPLWRSECRCLLHRFPLWKYRKPHNRAITILALNVDRLDGARASQVTFWICLSITWRLGSRFQTITVASQEISWHITPVLSQLLSFWCRSCHHVQDETQQALNTTASIWNNQSNCSMRQFKNPGGCWSTHQGHQGQRVRPIFLRKSHKLLHVTHWFNNVVVSSVMSYTEVVAKRVSIY